MKGFLYKIFKFFLILLITVSAAFGITYMLSYRNVSNIKLDKDTHILICGDSHTKTALNDSIIPNSLNIAHSSEHYLYSYNVLRVLLANNPQITTVLLGMSYHNLSTFYDDYIFDQAMTQYMYPRYAAVLDINSIPLILNHNFEGFTTDFKDIYHGAYRHINSRKLDDYSFIGWFYKSKRNNKNDSTINDALEKHYYRSGQDLYSISEFQLIYLRKIMKLCIYQDVKLKLINCPLSTEYHSQVPTEFLEYYDNLNSEFGQFILDYHDFTVPENCWGDGDHLNLSGSMIFSEFVVREMASQSR
ncbi:MAG: hypothetical protein DRJ15_02085 [Bacteroidetes bacterium]|nr:MAG: hypothetical protein DRJ15_02085 [Bacteroidota bacterium]